MPTYSNEPPNDPRGHSLTLKRTPINRALIAIVTSPDLVGCPTHFWGGRTVPCENPDCEPCRNGMPWRWHSYLSAWDTNTRIHFLYESTARATEPFVTYRKAYGSLRGCHFRARRANSAINSRVYIETQPADLEKIKLPQPPDLIKCLAIIWNLAEPTLDVEGLLKDVARVVVNKDGNGRLIQPQPATP
jgi:hypothetical protein